MGHLMGAIPPGFHAPVQGHGQWWLKKPGYVRQELKAALERPSDWQFIRALSRESGERIGGTWAHTPEQKARWKRESELAQWEAQSGGR